MQQLYYAGDHFLVADSICQAVLRYAQALSNASQADVITIPFTQRDGQRSSAHLLIGPASQIYSMPVPSDVPEPEDGRILAWLQDATNSLGADGPTSAFTADTYYYDPEWWDLPGSNPGDER